MDDRIMRHGTLLATENAEKGKIRARKSEARIGWRVRCVIDALSAVGPHRSQLRLQLEQQLNV
eukprot:scaffold81251_cov63-Phaeocystis_antarctica.AAC.1